MIVAVAGTFRGWTGDFQGFFLGLQMSNTKAYFEAHRRKYEEEVKAPMQALLSDLEAEFGQAKLARPNRDIRFAADKSPYKTNIYADCRGGGYVALDAQGLTAAGGRYMVEPPQLARYRLAVAADRSGKELVAIVDALVNKGYEVRHKRLIYWKRWDVEPWIATTKAREKVAKAWRDGADLNAWLAKHMDG
jgi:uncharacterized protein (TIGR02453 family)